MNTSYTYTPTRDSKGFVIIDNKIEEIKYFRNLTSGRYGVSASLKTCKELVESAIENIAANKVDKVNTTVKMMQDLTYEERCSVLSTLGYNPY